jgi:DNA-binding protein HU-beta
MTKLQFIDTVARAAKLPQDVTGHCIDATFDQIVRIIRKEKRFWMPGFGTFTVRRRKARKGFNPRTNKPMMIPAARFIGFRPAPQLKKGL